MRPCNHLEDSNLRPVGLGHPQKEGWRRLHAHLLSVREILPNPYRVLVAVETLSEALGIEAQSTRVGGEMVGGQRALAIEEPIVHLPILALFVGAAGGLGGPERIFVDRFDREVPNDVSDPTGVDIVAVNLRRRLLEVPATKGALIIRELDEDKLGVRAAL